MRFSKLAAAIVLAGATVFIAACGDTGAGDDAAVRDQNKKWLDAIVAKDAASIAQIYADDGAMMSPNAPKASGREAIQKGWEDLFKIPGVSLTFDTERLVFAKSGDLAVDIQTYKFTGGEGAAASTDTGKAVVTWVKRDGKWLVLTDMYSSDLSPPPPATPAAPPAETPAVDPSATTPPAPPAAAPAPATTPATPPTH